MKAYLKTAAVALAAYALIDLFQTNVMRVPVVGKFLPGGGDKAGGAA